MHVLMINGSPHPKGCTATALHEVATSLHAQGITTHMVNLGPAPVPGCIACYKCREKGSCVFQDDIYLECVEQARHCDALVVGSPVYYAGPNGSLCALLDRLFFSASSLLANKPAAAVVNCRRGGASATFDRLNKYFTINHMPVVSSQYWNSTHGNRVEELLQDLEGLQTMRALGNNMAWLLKNIEAGQILVPEREPKIATNFIR